MDITQKNISKNFIFSRFSSWNSHERIVRVEARLRQNMFLSPVCGVTVCPSKRDRRSCRSSCRSWWWLLLCPWCNISGWRRAWQWDKHYWCGDNEGGGMNIIHWVRLSLCSILGKQGQNVLSLRKTSCVVTFLWLWWCNLTLLYDVIILKL